jgi:hypothetical protein
MWGLAPVGLVVGYILLWRAALWAVQRREGR